MTTTTSEQIDALESELAAHRAIMDQLSMTLGVMVHLGSDALSRLESTKARPCTCAWADRADHDALAALPNAKLVDVVDLLGDLQDRAENQRQDDPDDGVTVPWTKIRDFFDAHSTGDIDVDPLDPVSQG